ncbi:hypothetical protein ACLOJK_037558, partial [Asimina triloba]
PTLLRWMDRCGCCLVGFGYRTGGAAGFWICDRMGWLLPNDAVGFANRAWPTVLLMKDGRLGADRGDDADRLKGMGSACSVDGCHLLLMMGHRSMEMGDFSTALFVAGFVLLLAGSLIAWCGRPWMLLGEDGAPDFGAPMVHLQL